MKLPFISNFDDFLALEHEPGVQLRFVDEVAELEDADLVILPGTKSTMADLAWLRREGFADAIERARESPAPGAREFAADAR